MSQYINKLINKGHQTAVGISLQFSLLTLFNTFSRMSPCSLRINMSSSRGGSIQIQPWAKYIRWQNFLYWHASQSESTCSREIPTRVQLTAMNSSESSTTNFQALAVWEVFFIMVTRVKVTKVIARIIKCSTATTSASSTPVQHCLASFLEKYHITGQTREPPTLTALIEMSIGTIITRRYTRLIITLVMRRVYTSWVPSGQLISRPLTRKTMALMIRYKVKQMCTMQQIQYSNLGNLLLQQKYRMVTELRKRATRARILTSQEQESSFLRQQLLGRWMLLLEQMLVAMNMSNTWRRTAKAMEMDLDWGMLISTCMQMLVWLLYSIISGAFFWQVGTGEQQILFLYFSFFLQLTVQFHEILSLLHAFVAFAEQT